MLDSNLVVLQDTIRTTADTTQPILDVISSKIDTIYVGIDISKNGLDWTSILSTLVGVVVGSLFTIIIQTNEDRKKRRKDEEEFRGVLSSVFLQFKRNLQRIEEALKNFESVKGNRVHATPSFRLISIAVDNSLKLITEHLFDKELLGAIIETYEEHQHLNRRWDIAVEILKKQPVIDIETEILACNVVIEKTKTTLESLGKYIESL